MDPTEAPQQQLHGLEGAQRKQDKKERGGGNAGWTGCGGSWSAEGIGKGGEGSDRFQRARLTASIISYASLPERKCASSSSAPPHRVKAWAFLGSFATSTSACFFASSKKSSLRDSSHGRL